MKETDYFKVGDIVSMHCGEQGIVLEILDDDLVIATPQKIIDNKISTKYQFWLDVSHSDWVKNDVGPLYNAWVMQSDWTKEEYTIEDDIFLSNQKTARILRKLLLLINWINPTQPNSIQIKIGTSPNQSVI